MAGDDHRAPAGRVADHHLAHLADLGRVETVGGLVEDEQVGQPEHGLGDGEALAHALRVGAHRAGERVAEPGDLQGLVQVGVAGRAAGGLPVQLQVLPAGQVRQEARALHEGADPRQHGRSGPDGVAEDADLAVVRCDQAHQHTQGGGLARAVGSEQTEHLALLDAEGQLAHRVPVGGLRVPLAQVLDHQRHLGQPCIGRGAGRPAAGGEQQGERGGRRGHRKPPHPGGQGRRGGGDGGGRRHAQVALEGDGVGGRGGR